MSNSLFDPLRNVLVFNRRRILIDNLYFRMHYAWTVIVLLSCALIVTSKVYIGEPINCMGSGDVKDIIKQYCFIHSTYTTGKFDKKGGWTYEPGEILGYQIFTSCPKNFNKCEFLMS